MAIALELPVVCGRSSLKPEVAASGFSIFIELQKSLTFYKLTRYFLKTPLSKRRYKSTHRAQPVSMPIKFCERRWRIKTGAIKRIKCRV
jgi:hypothetical protein